MGGAGGEQNLRQRSNEKCLDMHVQTQVSVNVNVLAHFIHSKNTVVNEILSMVLDYYR